MAAIDVMPIPLGNLIPAVALVFIELGLVFRDGGCSDLGASDIGLGTGCHDRPAADGMGLGQRVDPGLGLRLKGTD